MLTASETPGRTGGCVAATLPSDPSLRSIPPQRPFSPQYPSPATLPFAVSLPSDPSLRTAPPHDPSAVSLRSARRRC
ncbi:hypothetical protein PBY51_005702 [Eleginops maclovinus]|uniref:Uncharacterized protein n=1 Tax=Eleginops maclovinus TaxID=56733 RepID=A0AAN7WT58_ELEMC|nr:hypothetical protein PBY51_005702 [Eleginops maclovinus]